MILTLSAICLQKRIKAAGAKGLSLSDLPTYTREQLGLNGLTLPTSLLAGLDAKAIDRIRDSADKAACPCLVLMESSPQAMNADEEATGAAVERMLRVLQVAHRLGCNSVGMAIEARDAADDLEGAADAVKELLERADRLEINVLISPHAGLTATPDRATTLIKKVGGFRIGSLPDFQAAAASGDARDYLRRITPYAQSVIASTVAFKAGGAHEGYDLAQCVAAIAAVGFEGSLAIEHRGKGDVEEAVVRARQILAGAITGDEEE